ncbi:UDP-N-acetylmuramoyl-tripeptide--D-alanyl-D-alanine ligase [Variovorax sp. W1I1]|uniref:UDP-N-acetylmuramoyl-tripeptide--D-alanyl-D- alanine ligase n=1 Tax=Variovorax sp. W1I1 TaxID=3042309 RepID=UPI00278908F2|nr:UDP-N-acetylmuramoyl-tripeptide--D-alanyl-D-alanine ligase [Variovorax sp. W1I1]MDQ0610553.1 UDP-N-acetylmuramoyl-tripeptide--D-alanyl-D-alanine ligase [Variovorax sp. W1I1]
MTDMTPLNMTLAQAQQWIPGSRLVGDPATVIARVHTDTRTLADGDLFVALKGERFDANDFLAQAKEKGAIAAIAHHGLEAAVLAGLEVPDSLVALGALGAGWRAQFELPLIAVTGSNGKTTVTQMIAAILVAFRADRALATAGNFNNEIGVPLTLLRLRARHQHAVLELGMNHPGEIARLSAISRPTIALVNNAQREHQEFMATVEAVAIENAAVFAVLPDDGTAVFPYGDVFTSLWTDMAHDGGSRRCMTFGEDEGADISLESADWKQGAWAVRIRTPLGGFDAQLHIAGRHNVGNALAATACALAAGVPIDRIADGLSAFEPVKGRSKASEVVLSNKHVLTLVDDSYNANPDSVIAAIDVLAGLPGPHLLVLGDMGEVGNRAPEFHAEVGAWAKQCGIEAVYTLGAETAHTVAAFQDADNGRHFGDYEALHAAVLARLPLVGSVLVKGSRFMKMERVVQAIGDLAQSQPKTTKGGRS